jgi:hypothetical protein
MNLSILLNIGESVNSGFDIHYSRERSVELRFFSKFEKDHMGASSNSKRIVN